MQGLGDRLDRQTKGTWVRDGLANRLTHDEPETIIIDAVRRKEQIVAIRQSYGRRVVHIHLTAKRDELARRYAKRLTKDFVELPSFAEVTKNPTEAQIESLSQIADIVIHTDRCLVQDVVVRASSHLGLFGRGYERLVDVLVGGQYGSEGKGNIVSYLAREYDILVRVGGPNAGHKVFQEPAPYTFHQLPSGTRTSDARLVIAPGSVIDVKTLRQEIADCGVEAERLSIDPHAIVVERSDIRNERRLVKGIASTGRGVGWATIRRIRDRHPKHKVRFAADIVELRPFIRGTYKQLEKAFAKGERILLEGTQGTGLSLYHGTYPYVTSRDTTVAGCLAEAGISPSMVRRVIMVCRTYPIRVGNPDGKTFQSGPMSQEISLKEIAARSGLALKELQSTEITSTTHRPRRVAEFDWTLLRKGASLNGPTDIALTFVDYLDKENRKARRFEQLTPKSIQFIEEIERVAGASVSLISTRFEFRNIIDRRAWSVRSDAF